MLSFSGSHAPTKTWNPDCHRGEATRAERTLRRKDLWFFLGVGLFLVLLFFIWQQNRGMRLAAEVTRLELRRDALRAQVLDNGVAVAQLRQPDLLMRGEVSSELANLDLASRVFVRAPKRRNARLPAQDTWLASVGLGVSPALATEGR